MRKLLILALLCPFLSMCQALSLTGTVTTESGEPIEGATITILRPAATEPATNHQLQTTPTNAKGEFTLSSLRLGDTLLITAVGYEEAREVIDQGLARYPKLLVRLRKKIAALDDVVVMAYGTTTRRLATGNISKVSAEEIARQPVANPLAALEGRVPGLTIVQSGGLPGASVSVQLRGRASIAQGTEPFFIIDGVPFAPANNNVAQQLSVLSPGGGGLSPFATLSPADIESIEVLKDADATAIYGSRGANGVVLITTKKGRGGKTGASLSLSSGFSRVTRTTPLLNTEQYLQMRREAFANDGLAPTTANAPDLLLWNQHRYTDFTDLLLGGTARFSRAQASLSGGSGGTQFLLSGTWSRETTIFPGSMSDQKGSGLANLSHTAPNGRLSAALSLNYATGQNNLAAAGLAGLIQLPPNAPDLYTPEGKLNWGENGGFFNNPMAYLEQPYRAATSNLQTRLQLGYRLAGDLYVKTAVGYNTYGVDERSLRPIGAQNPAFSPQGSAQFSRSRFAALIIEPQLTWSSTVGRARLELLAGSTWQNNTGSGLSVSGGGYTSDALLASLAAAARITAYTNTETEYRYASLFGRATLNIGSRYLLNLSGRRDGSSRFGPGRQWADFGAIGAAWIFSAENGVRSRLPFLSFGKLRGSWGITGNDQIGDYRYLDAWGLVPPYAGTTALFPTNLFNPSYGWEKNAKLEAALDLGFFSDRVLLSFSWYRNRSSSQLVQYALPVQTGFTYSTDNLDATVQNTGLELELTTTNITAAAFTWTTAFNLSLPRNKLLAFPGLETSPYASTYVVGQPLSVIYRLKSTGVDPATGIFSFEDKDRDGSIRLPADYGVSGFTGPRFFGGFNNRFTFRGWDLNLFFTFKKQWGGSYLATLYTANIIPGTMSNQPAFVWDRWQAPGDVTAVQKFTAAPFSPAYAAVNRFRFSDGLYSDASFIRLKNLDLAYNLPAGLMRKWRLTGIRLFVQGQNLLTVTGYRGADPENQTLLLPPPLKTLTAGFTLTF